MELRWPICVAIGESDSKKMVEIAKKAKGKADLVEFRIDYSPSITENELKELIDCIDVPIILTVRKREEGGKFTGTEEERVEVIKRCISAEPNYIDIELSSQYLNQIVAEAKKRNISIICSFHSFINTPDKNFLLKKVEKTVIVEAEVVKVVTMAETFEDNLILLNLNEEAKKRGIEIVAFCMGAKGLISRVLCPFFGSKFTFASIGDPTAPGQISLEEMRKLQEVFT